VTLGGRWSRSADRAVEYGGVEAVRGTGRSSGFFIPEAAEFLAPVHGAAINAMTGAGCYGHLCPAAARWGQRSRSPCGSSDRAGGEVLRLWPDIGRRGPGMPLGIWPPPEDDDGPAAPPAPAPPSPSGFTR
jgi:hypothetical protein